MGASTVRTASGVRKRRLADPRGVWSRCTLRPMRPFVAPSGAAARLAALGLAIASSLLVGCGGDCALVCETAQSCKDPDVNVDACYDTCATRSDDSDAFYSSVERCADCLDGRQCSEQRKYCEKECKDLPGW